ncbi:hypothetical protein FNV43_RR21244 [Rhamnella rubrinervis]|uniref:Ubiquitin-like protease family profile domain-containing protein n=1 Tax=Rhamnella rubrinervis TaxID=2594499 RepID=A0A8K0DVW4_9ROSA|nr:hypothetical protein FNV43_RR21244 [Rhamnella rubrinervis]
MLYLRMQEIILSAGIVHNMLVRQANSICEDVMEFNFNGKGAIFTKAEFGFITGLKMENSVNVPPPPQSNRIRNKYFSHLKKIKNSNVRDVFLYSKRSKREDKDDMVRLGLIYFLECGLLGKKSQVWGYETIPLMRELYATKVDNSFPRICNWKATNLPVFKSVGKELFDNVEEYYRLDTYENMPMNEECEICDEETNVIQNDSEVQLISPSKVIQREPHIKKRARKLKLPFVVSIETRETLNNIFPPLMDFDPKKPFPDDISMKFFDYLTSEMDEVIDYSICEVNKEFFRDLVQEEWLNDKVLMPHNIKDTHWMLAKIDLPNRHVFIYDSTLMKSTNRDQFKPLWIMLPYILRQANFFIHRGRCSKSNCSNSTQKSVRTGTRRWPPTPRKWLPTPPSMAAYRKR